MTRQLFHGELQLLRWSEDGARGRYMKDRQVACAALIAAGHKWGALAASSAK